MTEQYTRWLACATADPDLSAELRAVQADAEALHDRFYRALAFGTGGLRGVIGAGTNRMNVYTVAQATQGLARYLLASGVPRRVAIAYDTRTKSDLFAHTAARVLCACGIEAHVYPDPMPTPALSFAVRHLHCGAGICVTASHNPAEYNGYKVYGSDGCQITDDAAAAILAHIERVEPLNALDIAPRPELLHAIDAATTDAFLRAVLAQRVSKGAPDLRIVYTPLHGTGIACVPRALREAGYASVDVLAAQATPDGRFPTCRTPNPEMPEALTLGLARCAETDADLLLATDPDCDRVGIAVRRGDGAGYATLTGNEVGVLLLDYICQARLAAGTMPERPLAVKTIVTTNLAARIAARYGVTLVDVLTGFKYIGEAIGALERAGEAGRYLLGFEESYGYLSGTHVRDKDAVNASLMICDMAAWHKARGCTLDQAIEDIYRREGYTLGALDSFAFAGAQGGAAMARFMRGLRARPIEALGGQAVEATRDYLRGIGDLPMCDVVQLSLRGGATITIRPSGTEPKLKVYYEAIAATREAAQAAMAAYRADVARMVRGAS